MTAVDTSTMEPGARMRRVRLSRGHSPQEAAVICRVSKNTLIGWERGSCPSKRHMTAAAGYYGSWVMEATTWPVGNADRVALSNAAALQKIHSALRRHLARLDPDRKPAATLATGEVRGWLDELWQLTKRQRGAS